MLLRRARRSPVIGGADERTALHPVNMPGMAARAMRSGISTTIDSTNEEARRLADAGETGSGLDHGRPPDARAAGGAGAPGNRARAISPPRCSCDRRGRRRNVRSSRLSPRSPQPTWRRLSRRDAAHSRQMAERCAGGRQEARGHLAGIRQQWWRRLDWLAIGIGVNLAEHPEGTDFPPRRLRHLGTRPPAPREALVRLAAALREMV